MRIATSCVSNTTELDQEAPHQEDAQKHKIKVCGPQHMENMTNEIMKKRRAAEACIRIGFESSGSMHSYSLVMWPGGQMEGGVRQQ